MTKCWPAWPHWENPSGLATQGKPAQLTTPTDRCDAATARAGSNGVDGLPLVSVVWPGASSVSGSRFASG